MPPETLARDKQKALDNRRRAYKRGRDQLVTALNQFIDSHLAAMLAAEAEGGPVVGLAPATDSQLEVSWVS
jgi:hypothetical protein